MKLTELAKATNYFKILLYAPSGFGKTCAAANAPGKIEWWDFDHKISSVISFYKNKPEILDRIEVFQFNHLDPKKRIPELEARMKLIEAARLNNTKLPFDTLVVDSLTTLTEALMEDYLIRSQLGIKVAIKDIPAMQHYQILDKHLTQFISGLLALPCNVIMLGHLDVYKDDSTGAMIRQPLMKGKWAAKLPIYFEEVYVGKIVGEKRIIQTQPDSTYAIARTQRGLAKEIPVEDMFKI